MRGGLGGGIFTRGVSSLWRIPKAGKLQSPSELWMLGLRGDRGCLVDDGDNGLLSEESTGKEEPLKDEDGAAADATAIASLHCGVAGGVGAGLEG